jgi:PilZ domain-containing protein
VPSLSERPFEVRMKQLRAGMRVNSRVPVAVEWEESRTKHTAQGLTVDISPSGCLAIVPQGFALGQKLKLVNLVNKSVCSAVLVWRGHEGRTGWELGLELQDPPDDFWGLDF